MSLGKVVQTTGVCADYRADKKAREEMAKKAGGKGPMNTGQQGKNPLSPRTDWERTLTGDTGIKKSGKK